MKYQLYANRSMDLTILNSKDFEEITYHYFNEQIKDKLFLGRFDNVELSVGVGERGADLKLYYKGTVVGCVQCKQYSKNVDENTIFNDIVKLLMNHIDECIETSSDKSSIINSIDDFTYYFVVSKDFTQNAKDLMGEFNTKWKKLNLLKTVDQIKNKYTKLKHFEFNNNEILLKNLLNEIRVVPLISLDIERIIRSKTDIIQKYFVVEKIIDESSILEIKNEISGIKLSKSEIDDKARNASNGIESVKDFFGKDRDQVINRKEVLELINWVNDSLTSDQDNIAVVSGNAGYGKSVIISKLYRELLKQGLKAICLKADLLAFSTIEDLGKETGLEMDFHKFMNLYLEKEEKVILIIDQIDALSQSLSSDMKPLRMYDRLIRNYIGHPNIRIIISCRTYDLSYDPIINTYSGKRNFIIQPLDINQVENILTQALNIDSSTLKPTLIQLLQTPLHLEVFIKIYSQNLEIDLITSVQDLYTELWKQKINNNLSGKEVKINFTKVVELVYAISEKMYLNQVINISSLDFEDKFNNELQYLKTEEIVYEKNNRLEFFHQTFFDYCVARGFVVQNKNILDDILSRHQGLFLRSKIKQIINYKRGTDNPREYINDIKNILSNIHIRYHIKVLLLQFVAFQDNPTKEEINLIQTYFNQKNPYKDLFISFYHGGGWLEIFINKGWLVNEINNGEDQFKTIGSFLRSYTNRKTFVLLNFFESIKQNEWSINFIIDFLWGIKEFDKANYTELIDNCIKIKKDSIDEFHMYYFLEKAINNFPEWVVQKLTNKVFIDNSDDIFDRNNFFPGQNIHTNIYEMLWEIHPDYSYHFVKHVIKEIINKSSYSTLIGSRKEIRITRPFLLYSKTDTDLYFHHKQCENLQNHLVHKLDTNKYFAKKEAIDFYHSNNLIEIIIGLSVMNEKPNLFLKELYGLFSNCERLKALFGLNQYLDFLVRSCLKNSYDLFNENQRLSINNTIISFYPDYERKLIDYGDGKKIKNKTFGSAKYNLMSVIPNTFLIQDKILFKEYNELKRKFGKRDELKAPKAISVFSGGKAMTASAYDNMSFENWKKSFRKYSTENKKYNTWNDVDELTHSRLFEEKVATDIKKYIILVREIVKDSTIPQLYKVKGLEGLKKGKIEPEILLPVFVEAIENNKFNAEQNQYLLWLTSYFSNAKLDNNIIFDFILNTVIYGNESSRIEDDLLNNGINSERGAALSALMDYYFSEDKRNKIFETLYLISDSSSPATKACAIYKLSNFLQSDVESTLKLFLILTKDYDPGLVKLSVHLLTFLINSHFHKLIPFLKKSIYIEEATESIGHILTKAYCFEYEHSDELINEFWNQGVNQIKSTITISLQFLKANSCVPRALEILSKFLDFDNEEIAKPFSFAFLNLNTELFNDLYPFLIKYVQSKIGLHREDSFYKYLLNCSYENPEKCIHLASYYHNHIDRKIDRRMHKNEPLNVIIQSYNQIREYDNKSPILEQAMNSFDNILKNNHLRSGAFEILSKIDMY